MKQLFSAVMLAICLVCSMHAHATMAPAPYEKVSNLLSRVRQTEDLPDTVHKNRLLIKAVGLFLEAADKENITREQMIRKLNSLFPMPLWKEWVPVFEIEKVKNKLYLVSIGYAAVTQESSIYLFQDASHLKIDTGDLGLIHIVNVQISGYKLEVTYLRTPGSTRPEKVIALLNNKDGKWRISKRSIQTE